MFEHPSCRIDLRSDTITQPTPGMREAMASAKVGDDVFGEDPTVIELEERMASSMGKEAGLMVPSGTMANAIAIRTHTQPGDEIITEEHSHIYVYEAGGFAALSGCSVALVQSERGIMTAEAVTAKIRKPSECSSHYPNGSLVCLENTSNRGGGTFYPQSVIDEIAQVARQSDCALHVDGARLFNAAVVCGEDPARIVRDCDSVSICISKGLGAPVGGVLVGSRQMIGQAHRWRKMFGGGMRQAGVLAAAGLYALDHNVQRLAEDHTRANALATAIQGFDSLEVDVESVQTNIIYVRTKVQASEVVESAAGQGIDFLALGPNLIRLVAHLHITDEDIGRTMEVFHELYS
jgi:threonine aldolase